MSRISTKKVSTLALLSSAVFTISSLAPIEFAPGPFSPDAAFAKSENANGGNRGGNSGDKGGNGGGKGGEKSASSGGNNGNNGGGKGVGNNGGGKGVGGSFSKATQKGGNLIKSLFGRDKVKTQKATAPQGKPKAVVRQYVLANSLKQGDVAKMLKSWNSLNRNEQAYLNNMDNPNSLPGKQIDYVRASLAVDAAAAEFEALDGDLLNPPSDADLAGATAVLGDTTALDSALTAAGHATLEDYNTAVAGDPNLADATVDTEATAMVAAQAVVDQYEAYYGEGGVEETQAAADDAFMEASVSYSGDYDEATMGELRETVDAIIELKELDTLVEEADAAAAAEAEAAAAAEAEAAATEEETVVLRTGEGETVALVVE